MLQAACDNIDGTSCQRVRVCGGMNVAHLSRAGEAANEQFPHRTDIIIHGRRR